MLMENLGFDKETSSGDWKSRLNLVQFFFLVMVGVVPFLEFQSNDMIICLFMLFILLIV